MKHRGIFWRMVFMVVASATIFYFIGYEAGVRDSRDFVLKEVAK